MKDQELWPARGILVQGLIELGEASLTNDDDMIMLGVEARGICPFKRRWYLSAMEREVRKRASEVSGLSYHLYKDHDRYSLPAVVDPEDIISLSYRMATTYEEMFEMLDALLVLHKVIRDGVSTSQYPIAVHRLDIGMSPQHPRGFVNFIGRVYWEWKTSRSVLLLEPILLPVGTTFWNTDEEHAKLIEGRLRIGVTEGVRVDFDEPVDWGASTIPRWEKENRKLLYAYLGRRQ